MSEQEKFLCWYETERQDNNLVDVKFYPGDVSQTSPEDFFREMNAVNTAIKENRIVTNEGIY